jgi:hypothetical protein
MTTSSNARTRRLRAPAVGVIAVLLAAACARPPSPPLRTPAPPSHQEKLLIKHGWDAPRAQFVHDHVTTMEAQGFDGVVISLGAFWNQVYSQTPISANALMIELKPLAETTFRTMRHNFALVYSANAGSYFADYSVPIENFRILARTARQLGLAGIVLDTEDYNSNVQNWPEAAPDRTLNEARDQAAQRGTEIVRAIAEEWPTAVVIVLGGPLVSEPATADAFKGRIAWNDVAFAMELRGPFFVGMADAAAGSGVTIVDGGGVYTLRTAEQFDVAYSWMKRGLANQSPLVPDHLRDRWASTVNVSFGVYDLPWIGQPMDAGHWQTTLTAALCRADRWVWAYTERYDWWGRGWPTERAPAAWVDATRRARANARNCDG